MNYFTTHNWHSMGVSYLEIEVTSSWCSNYPNALRTMFGQQWIDYTEHLVGIFRLLFGIWSLRTVVDGLQGWTRILLEVSFNANWKYAPHKYRAHTSRNGSFITYLVHSFIEIAVHPNFFMNPGQLVTSLVEGRYPLLGFLCPPAQNKQEVLWRGARSWNHMTCITPIARNS